MQLNCNILLQTKLDHDRNREAYLKGRDPGMEVAVRRVVKAQTEAVMRTAITSPAPSQAPVLAR